MKTNYLNIVLLASACAAGCVFTGCQVSVAGQNLPSAYFLEDDLQYFPKGPEFKLSREAAAQKKLAPKQQPVAKEWQKTIGRHANLCRLT